MPLYVRHTQSVQFDQLPGQIASKLAEHAESRQINLAGVRLWQTHSENPPASFSLELGPEPAAAECFSAVRAAITAAGNP